MKKTLTKRLLFIEEEKPGLCPVSLDKRALKREELEKEKTGLWYSVVVRF